MRVFLLALGLLAACGGTALPPGFVRAAQFAILSPSDGGAANVAQPVLRWTPVVGADMYEVSVAPDGPLASIVDAQRVTDPFTQVVTPLTDGVAYRVDVAVLDAAGNVIATDTTRFAAVIVPDSFPPMELVVHDRARAQGGYKLFNLFDGNPDLPARLAIMVLINAVGEIVWYYVHPENGGISDTRVLDNGNLLFQMNRFTGPDVSWEAREIAWDGTELWRSRPEALVHHSVSDGPGGDRMYLTWVFDEYQGESYEGDGIEIVDPATNDVLWSWNIFDHFAPEDFQVPDLVRTGLSGLGLDWSHANAAVWDPARGVIWMSIRHFERIIGIDYPSGDVRITLGQGGLGGDGAMSHQHAPEVQADGQILFWDNGNLRPEPLSRAVMVDFDELTGRYEETFVWTDTPPFYDFAVGDADRQPNGNVLITAGISGRLIEVTPAGGIAWELLVPRTHTMYRAEQVPVDRIPKGVLPFD